MIADYVLCEFFSAYVMHNFVRRYIFSLLGYDVRRKCGGTRKKCANLERYRSWFFFQAMIDYDACNRRKVKLIVTDEAMQTWAFW